MLLVQSQTGFQLHEPSQPLLRQLWLALGGVSDDTYTRPSVTPGHLELGLGICY